LVSVFDRVEGHEEVVYFNDPSSGLRAIIAIHSTVLGPALGGTRFYPYFSEDAALQDVLRLSRGMTYKAAAAGLDLGGGKAVIIGDPKRSKSEHLLRAYGRFVESLGGRYITAEDVGTSRDDMDIIRRCRRPWAGPVTRRRSPRTACTCRCWPARRRSGTRTRYRDGG
jgi:valine dehydrogenase (NAD+)